MKNKRGIKKIKNCHIKDKEMEEPFDGLRINKKYYNNDTKCPIYIFTFGAKFKVSEFEEFVAFLDRLLIKEKKPFVFIADASRCENIPSARVPIILTTWMRNRKPDIPEILLGSSAVCPSKIIRYLIDKAFSIQKPTAECKITKTIEESMEFVNKVYEKNQGLILQKKN